MGGKQYREDRTTGEAIIERVSGEFKRADGEDTKNISEGGGYTGVVVVVEGKRENKYRTRESLTELYVIHDNGGTGCGEFCGVLTVRYSGTCGGVISAHGRAYGTNKIVSNTEGCGITGEND